MNSRHLFRAWLVVLLTSGVLVVLSCTTLRGTGADNAPELATSPLATPTALLASTEPIVAPSPTSPPTSVPSPTAITATDSPLGHPIPTYTYKVLKVFPHDRDAYTQGLVFQDGILYEGTGLEGRSSLRKVDLESGKILQLLPLPVQFFGEGVAVFGDNIVQLTWHSHEGFVYDKESFELLRAFSYPTEGWGLTYDGSRLIMSDGTATLHFLDPESLTEIERIEVYDEGSRVIWLNELEYVEGEIYANIWQTDCVARIDPQSGQVTGWVELDGLLTPEDQDPPVSVLNGIAYDAEHKRLFVTGKLWPKIFEIELIPVGH